jgi:hypothetical protein
LGLAERSPKWRPQNGGQARERIHGEKAMGALEKWREGKVRQGQGVLVSDPRAEQAGEALATAVDCSRLKGENGGGTHSGVPAMPWQTRHMHRNRTTRGPRKGP